MEGELHSLHAAVKIMGKRTGRAPRQRFAGPVWQQEEFVGSTSHDARSSACFTLLLSDAIVAPPLQVVNHTFFWEGMAPGKGGEPSGKLGEAIAKDFGSFEEFKKAFSAAGATQFGSGWAWLSVAGDKLEITKTPNAENPWVHGNTPILTMDVWEHAYYLDVQVSPSCLSSMLARWFVARERSL